MTLRLLTISLPVSLIMIYRNTLSTFMLPSCRFVPSCSVYAEQAIQRYGLVHGGMRALGRLLRCHPWSPGGPDLVP